MEFSRQEYWSGLPCPPPGDLPNPGIKPVPPALAGGLFTTEPPGKPSTQEVYLIKTWLEGLSKQFLAKDFFPVVIQSFDWEDPLEVEMATHSSILAWETPWTEEPGGLQSVGLQRVIYN